MKTSEDVTGDTFYDVRVVGVRGLVARLDHVHPSVAIHDQLIFKGFTGGILGTDDANETLIFQVILPHIPSQFMRELKALDQALLLKIGNGRCCASTAASSSVFNALR